MFSASYFALTTALLSLVASTSAGYDPLSKNNVAIYYGQGPNEANLGLAAFCDNSNVDIIPLGFLDIYPAQGNGWPGTNFASSCESTNFAAPGPDNTKDDLKNNCPSLVNGIAHCQSQGKQILLSLGGAPGTTQYQLTSDADAKFLADFLWGAFGPIQTPNNYPRPFDTAAISNSVDGFDFDIEVVQPGEQQYYITMINQLRSHFPKTGKKYLITGAPQCITPDSQMGDMITAVPFDILFVQYYNTDSCSAREWKTLNPSFPSVAEVPSGFSYEFYQLLTFLDAGASKNAKIFFGLPGADAAANANEYVSPTDVAPLLEAYYCQPRFGGVMVWEGIYAYNNNKFQNSMKSLLIADSNNKSLPKCATPPPCCTKPYTIASGDSCSLIASNNGFSTLASFLALNPSLGPNGEACAYLQPRQTLCLARASSTTAVCSVSSASKTTTTTSTTSGTPTPTPCVTCTQYYTFKSGDSCYNTWTTYKLTSAEFYALNPTLSDSACSKLPVGAQVCVAGSTYTCPLTTTTSTTTSSSSSKTSSTTTTKSTSTTSSTTTKSSTTTSSTSSASSSSTKTSTTTSSSTSSTSSSSSTTSATTSSSTTSTSSSSTKTSTTSSTTSSTSSPSSSTTKSSTTSSNTSSSTSSSSSSTKSSTITSSTTSTTNESKSSSSPSSSSSSTSYSIATSTSSAPPTTSSSSTSSSSSSSSSFVSFSNSTTSSMMSISSPVTYTTTTTSVYTVTSCPPTVTNCPIGHVTTDILTITTTYCPASATSTTKATSSPIQYTTSVVYTTLTYTITACPVTVTNCPAKIGQLTTETKVLYTTICPVSAANTPVVVPTSAAPGGPAKVASIPGMANAPSTSLNFSPVTYSTAGVPKASSSSSFAVVYQTMSVMPVASTPPSKSVAASASSVKPGAATFTGGAANTASLGVGGIMAVVLCMVGWALM